MRKDIFNLTSEYNKIQDFVIYITFLYLTFTAE